MRGTVPTRTAGLGGGSAWGAPSQGGRSRISHCDKQIDEAAQRFEQLADDLDPETAKV